MGSDISGSGAPTPQYHVTGFIDDSVKGPVGKGSLAEMLFSAFNDIINDYKKGMVADAKQLAELKKLETAVTKLMGAINAMTSNKPGDTPQKVAAEVQADLGSVEKLVNALPNSSYKSQLIESLDQVKALLSSKTDLSAVIQLQKDLKKFIQLIETLEDKFKAKSDVTTDQMAPYAKDMVQDIKNLNADKTPLAAAIKAMSGLFGKDSSIVKGMTDLLSRLNYLVNALTCQKGKGGIYYFNMFGKWSVGEAFQKALGSPPDYTGVEAFLANLVGAGYKDHKTWHPFGGGGGPYYTGVHGWDNFFTHLKWADESANHVIKTAPSFSLADKIKIIREMASGKVTQTAFGKLWSAYQGAVNGVQGSLVTTGDMGNSLVIKVNVALQGVQMVAQTLAKQEETPMRLINQAMSRILKR